MTEPSYATGIGPLQQVLRLFAGKFHELTTVFLARRFRLCQMERFESLTATLYLRMDSPLAILPSRVLSAKRMVKQSIRQPSNGIAIDGTRETVNGNVIKSDGTIVYSDGTINRDITRTGNAGNSVSYSGQASATGSGVNRTGVRTFPNASSSQLNSSLVRNSQGYIRSTNRSLPNGQFVQGFGAVNIRQGGLQGYRGRVSTSGRGYLAQSYVSRTANGYSKVGTRQPNFQRSYGGRGVARRRGR